MKSRFGSRSLDELWNSAPSAKCVFGPELLMGLPKGVQQYLEHAIAPLTPLASAVRLRMHGHIKLKRWLPFTAEQVINNGHEFIWAATAWMNGMPIRGFDRLEDGEGVMRWKLLGLLPVMAVSGPDITRSAVGRAISELVWLPSALCSKEVSWTSPDSWHVHARVALQGEAAELAITINDEGRPQSLTLQRWAKVAGASFSYADFGGVVEDEAIFGGYRIPSVLRLGYFVGTDRFEPDGEFIRITIDDATYR